MQEHMYICTITAVSFRSSFVYINMQFAQAAAIILHANVALTGSKESC